MIEAHHTKEGEKEKEKDRGKKRDRAQRQTKVRSKYDSRIDHFICIMHVASTHISRLEF